MKTQEAKKDKTIRKQERLMDHDEAAGLQQQ